MMDNCKRSSQVLRQLQVNVIRNLEYNRLQSLIPNLAQRQGVQKIEVIEEAIKYIAALQNTLSTHQQLSAHELRERFLERERLVSRPSPYSENNRRSSMYFQRRRHQKSLRDFSDQDRKEDSREN